MARIYDALRKECRAFLRRLLGCDCRTADLAAIKRAYDQIADRSRAPSQAPPPGPEWAPLAEPAEAAIDALWKVPHDLRGRRWYDAVYYCLEVKAKAEAAGAAQDVPAPGAP